MSRLEAEHKRPSQNRALFSQESWDLSWVQLEALNWHGQMRVLEKWFVGILEDGLEQESSIGAREQNEGPENQSRWLV